MKAEEMTNEELLRAFYQNSAKRAWQFDCALDNELYAELLRRLTKATPPEKEPGPSTEEFLSPMTRAACAICDLANKRHHERQLPSIKDVEEILAQFFPPSPQERWVPGPLPQSSNKEKQPMSQNMTPVAADDPRMIAWKTYTQTPEYANVRKWALALKYEAGRRDIRPERREQNVEGSLWTAFIAGFEAALAAPPAQPSPQASDKAEFPCPACTVHDRAGDVSHSVDAAGEFAHSPECPKASNPGLSPKNKEFLNSLKPAWKRLHHQGVQHEPVKDEPR